MKAEFRMRRQLHINPHLAIVVLACAALTGATTYFLLAIPRHLTPSDPDWLAAGASWATAFVAQFGVFFCIMASVAAHALSGRWGWSVRIFIAVSAYAMISLSMLALNAYEDAERASGHARSAAQVWEGALTLAAGAVFYLAFTTSVLVWIATRGQRFRFSEATKRTHIVEPAPASSTDRNFS
ncbi:unnamed protein product [Gemmata massiliana]|uniref:Uncharacterized protein n=2 Tax=Gemmata massiliana TaxID=1210884 RepID=A0A6P2DL51_9BACT|nr:unnamed protein product [Gemmata massiliana]